MKQQPREIIITIEEEARLRGTFGKKLRYTKRKESNVLAVRNASIPQLSIKLTTKGFTSLPHPFRLHTTV